VGPRRGIAVRIFVRANTSAGMATLSVTAAAGSKPTPLFRAKCSAARG
jgi:hypothetical protein